MTTYQNELWIYVLLCKDNYYYVGRTSNPSKRLEDHFVGDGSVWTQLHSPLKVLEVRQSFNKFDETAVTLEYMDSHCLGARATKHHDLVGLLSEA